jgi:hypothetical protein
LETRDGEDAQRIVGMASVYYDGSTRTEYELWNGAVERIKPGAFDRAIMEDDVRALFNHDSNQVLGRTKAGTLTLQSREDGLYYATIPSEATVYADVRAMIRRGDVDGSSFQFRVLKESWSRDEERKLDVRELEEIQLFDVGPVTFPAYTATTTGVRAVGPVEEARASWNGYRSQIAARERRALYLHLLELGILE